MKKIFRDIKDALFGSEQDYTQISLKRAIFLLAVPMVLEMLMESLFAIWDMWIVSKLGDEAVAVIGLTESLMTIIYAIGIGVAMATTGLIARRIGEKNIEAGAAAGGQAINLAVLIAFILGIPGVFFARDILALMKAEPHVIEDNWYYTAYMMGGNIFIMLLFINNAIFRSTGNPALALRVLFIANTINIILDPCLVFGLGPFPELGIKGAAIATNIGRGIGVVYQFYILAGKEGTIRLKLQHLKIKVKIMWKVLFLSGGGILQFLIATASWIVLYRILADYKSEVISGYTIGIRIFVFFLLPSWGLSNAVSTLVGQNLGAKNPKRAEQSVWFTSAINSIYLLLIMFIFQFYPDTLVQLFETSDISYNVATTSLRIISFGMLFYGIEMVIGQAFNGAGDTYTPSALNFIGFWIIQIPLAWYLAKVLNLEQNGVFYAIFISESILAILGILIFLKGKWKLREV